jgi:hypothetical protein
MSFAILRAPTRRLTFKELISVDIQDIVSLWEGCIGLRVSHEQVQGEAGIEMHRRTAGPGRQGGIDPAAIVNRPVAEWLLG